jgi:hypothetical protein
VNGTDYGNLLCSCSTDSIHCGAKKGNEVLEVHPLLTDCTRWFEFGSAGTIAPSAESVRSRAARAAIKVLGLDAPALEVRRREASGAMFEEVEEKTVEETRAMVPLLLAPDVEGRFLPHAAAVAAVLMASIGEG